MLWQNDIGQLAGGAVGHQPSMKKRIVLYTGIEMRRQVLLENEPKIPINEDTHDSIPMTLTFSNDMNEIGWAFGCVGIA